LWLSTVPPTSGLVAVMFGPRYMATLFGFVFLSHQIGSASYGVWLGGRLYEAWKPAPTIGEAIWWMHWGGIVLGIFAAYSFHSLADLQEKPRLPERCCPGPPAPDR
jgi:hypothetical protein